jgi:three-Cys-motif partner protein
MFRLATVEDDNQEIADVKPWSADKHYFLQRYIDAFTTAMKDKSWASLHYIDLFAGPGIECIEGKGLAWGSPLIAAQATNRFQRLHLSEKNSKKHDALASRLRTFAQPSEPQLICGDANIAVEAIVDELPDRSLSLAFLDPYGLHLHFQTLRRLSQRRVDLIILFPDHLDALRNWDIYLEKDNSNLDLVLGTDRWRRATHSLPSDRWGESLRQIYEAQIRQLGYVAFAHQRISRRDGCPLYMLIFCSKNKTGTRIWRGISGTQPNGQRSLFGPDH